MSETQEIIAEFKHKSPTLLDEVRAGGRIPLIIGRNLTDSVRESLKKTSSIFFARPEEPSQAKKVTLWRKKWWEGLGYRRC
ncbi:MAG: hypothetical protein Ct9H90mP4_03410 [Gammaproteobacteria bacterium]|nr:MAG: hypothetical protein Ct9H90mP4_03410 [Gammaproteobacteria bacterium]